MGNKSKITFGLTTGFFFLCVARGFSQTTIPGSEGIPDYTGNILIALWSQIVNNPASLSVIPFLCVIAFLVDDLPFINSRYVVHITVIVGMSIYWGYCDPHTVSKIYPHPFAIYISNGAVCGFIAWGAHRQAIARMMKAFRARRGAELSSQ